MKLLQIILLALTAYTLQINALTQKENQFLDDAAHGNLQEVEQYVNAGGDVNVQFDKTGDTALHFALANGHGAVAKYLHDHGANATIQNMHGHTPKEIGTIFAQARQAQKEGLEGNEEDYKNNHEQEVHDRKEVNQAYSRALNRPRMPEYTQPL